MRQQIFIKVREDTNLGGAKATALPLRPTPPPEYCLVDAMGKQQFFLMHTLNRPIILMCKRSLWQP
jgi:hypothetical protein